MSIFFEILVRIASYGPQIDQSNGENRLSHIIKCVPLGSFLKARTREASCAGDWTCYGLYDPTTLTSRKTLLKNRLPILFKLFRVYPDSPCYLKERNFVWH